MKCKVYQHIRATNDTNGNPRRVFVVWEVSPTKYGKEFPALGGHRNTFRGAAEVIAVIDEGYSGRPSWVDPLPYLGGATTTPKEYREWLRLGKKLADEAPYSATCKTNSGGLAGIRSAAHSCPEEAEGVSAEYLKARGGGEAIIYKGARIVRRFTVQAPRRG